MLRTSLLFQNASDAVLERVGQAVKTVFVKQGEPILLEGEVADAILFLYRGAAEVIKYRPDTHDIQKLTVLRAGAHLSDFSILSRTNEVVSIFALEDCELLQLTEIAFIQILQEDSSLSRQLITSLAEMNDNIISENYVEALDPAAAIPNPDDFKMLPPVQWKKFGVVPFFGGAATLVIAAKDPWRADFLEHCKTVAPEKLLLLTQLSDAAFDHYAKQMQDLAAQPSAAKPVESVVPLNPSDVGQRLRLCSYFSSIQDKGLHQLEPLFEPIDLKAGEFVFTAGDSAEYFYILDQGRVDFIRPVKNDARINHVVSRNAKYLYSEIQLILDTPYSFSARASSPTRLWRLPKARFEMLLQSGVFCFNLSRVLAQRLVEAMDKTEIRVVASVKKPDLQQLTRLVPRSEMVQNLVVPLNSQNDQVTLGIVKPDWCSTLGFIGRCLRNYRVQFEWVALDEVRSWFPEAVVPESPSEVVRQSAGHVNYQTGGNNSVLELNKMLVDGYDARASDLHIEPLTTGFRLRYRIDGVLSEIATKLPTEVGETIINRIKVLSKMDISVRMTPQDGQLKTTSGTRELIARVSTVPTKHGEGAVLRLVRNRNATIPLSMLIPDRRAIRILQYISRCKQGLFLVTGPTGSGKTTTLYSLVAALNHVDVKVISLEDPVEMEIPGTTQIEINDKQGLTFEKALRSTLRQDPDVMMVGEIRDDESAKIVFEAALSGHLVISTVHTNNSFSIKSRLKELGVPVGTMGDGLIGAMAQRLVRAICQECRVPRKITESEQLTLTKKLRLQRAPLHLMEGKGCHHCNFTGYYDRIPIMEIWKKTPMIQDLFASDSNLDDMVQAARGDGFENLYECGLRMVLNGLTTLSEVERCMTGAA